MIVAMQEKATEDQIDAVIGAMTEAGVEVHRTTGESQTILAGVGPTASLDLSKFELLPGVMHVHRISSPYKLAGRGWRPEGTVIEFRNGVKLGGERVLAMAGPCSIESREQIFETAKQREGFGRHVPARRRLQAAQFALFLPGNGHSRPRADARSRRCARPARGQRGHGDFADRTHAAASWTCSRWARATCRTSTCCANWARCASRCCSSAAWRPPSKNCCSRASTSSPAATTTSSSANAASAPTKPPPATPWTSPPFPW